MVSWYRESDMPLILILSSFGLVGIAVLMFTQFVMRRLLQTHSFSRFTFVFWFLGELLLLSLLMMLIYGEVGGSLSHSTREFYLAFRNTSLVVVIPYFGTVWYLHYRRRLHNVERLPDRSLRHLVHIRDEKGVLRLAVSRDVVLFFQSSDNYVTVFYHRNGSVRKELVRTTLKRLEKELDTGFFVRCHRSYIVNMAKVRATNKGLNNMYLELDDLPDAKIHVSRKFRTTVLRLLDKKTMQAFST